MTREERIKRVFDILMGHAEGYPIEPYCKGLPPKEEFFANQERDYKARAIRIVDANLDVKYPNTPGLFLSLI